MKKVYHLSSCSTCQRILNDIGTNDFVLQDIKQEAISESQLEEIHSFTSSYENLFSKRAMKYKSMGLKDKKLQEEDFKNLILEEYTFFKRRVFIIQGEVFVGNSKKVVEAVKKILSNECCSKISYGIIFCQFNLCDHFYFCKRCDAGYY